ncbi:MAG: radical SAM/SPASM domain-containing protein [Acidobacteriota bacterium]
MTTIALAETDVEAWVPEPFLHLGDGEIYNPLTDRTLRRGQPGFGALEAVVFGGAPPASLSSEDRQQLLAEGWLVSTPATDSEDLFRRYHLRYASLETHTVCNQACYFCPVSIDPRKAYFMPTELFERLAKELAAYRDTLEGVFLMSYNEPTVDKRFVDQCQTLMDAGLAVGVNSNASGLTPAKIDALVEMGPLGFLSINLSTIDRDKYRQDRRRDHLDRVLRHLDYAKDRPVAHEMVIMVLGTGDEQHLADFEAIRQRYGSNRFDVQMERIMDRAGHLDVGLKPEAKSPRLCGCENLGSRPLQHLHITPHGQCVLCCEDYDEKYIIGDLNHSTIDDILKGDRIAQLRRWIYGVEDPPDDFICNGCIFARTR